jgi:hypothetical protein
VVGQAVGKGRQPGLNKLAAFVKFGKKGDAPSKEKSKGKLARSGCLSPLFNALQLRCWAKLRNPKTRNPLIIREKKAEIKLSFISVNQKKGEICDLVLRNQWFFS